METIPLKDLAQFGVAGILAGVMFGIYRKDMREYAAKWEDHSKLFMGIVKENTAAITALIEIVRTIDARRDRR